MKEQKDSLQTIEARRKAEQEQKAREAEKERIRAEIETHAKQKELEERARKDAERREREEKAAREKAEADALREKEAKAQEAARQEALRKAEELRQKKEQEEVLSKAARAEVERKERERLAREEAVRLERLRKAEEAKAMAAKQERERRERDAKERQERAIEAFTAVVKDGTATEFYAKIKDCIPNSITPDLHRKLSQAGNSKLSRTDRIAAIVALTKDVQDVSRELREYSSLTLENVDADLADATNEKRTKDFLSRIRDDIMEFDREAEDFTGKDASGSDTQMKCIRIIRSVPKWFDF